MQFAHKMTVDSDSVTDDEFAELVKNFGEKQAASMVLLMAYSNYQDRLLLCLGAPLESGIAAGREPNAGAVKRTIRVHGCHRARTETPGADRRTIESAPIVVRTHRTELIQCPATQIQSADLLVFEHRSL